MMNFQTETPLPFAFLPFFSNCWFCMEYLLCFLWHDLSGGKCIFLWVCLLFEYPPLFPVSFYITAWAEHSPTDSSDSDLLSAWWAENLEQLPGCFVCVGRHFLFSFCPLKVISSASCSFVWSGFWDTGSVPGLCDQVLLWLVNLHVQVAADHSVPLLWDSSAAALLFCLKRTAQRTSLEENMRVETPAPSEYCEITLKNHPVDQASLQA